jgi:calcium-dependent protein kinase
MAPEVLKRDYNEKCDVWSCGVILYILLSGEPPFKGETDSEIMDNVQLGTYSMDPINYVSEEGKNLIRNLLKYEPAHRFTAIEALESPWIKHLAPNAKLNKAETNKILGRLKSFRTDKKLQEATLAFIVSQLITKDEVLELKKVFLELDENKDGILHYDEIVKGYKRLYGSENPEVEAKLIFEQVDSDKNGFISYDEFIRATIDRSKILTDQKLDIAFNQFDKNGDGFISAAEIKEVLGRNNIVQEEIWKEIVKEVDINGDGEVSLEEFKQMMQKILGQQKNN